MSRRSLRASGWVLLLIAIGWLARPFDDPPGTDVALRQFTRSAVPVTQDWRRDWSVVIGLACLLASAGCFTLEKINEFRETES